MPAKKKPAQRKPAEEAEPVGALPEEWEVAPEPGWVDPALAEEFPGLSDPHDHASGSARVAARRR